MVDVNLAMIKWLRECPQLQRRLYPIFGKEENDSKIFTPLPDKPYEKEFIDGSKLKHFTMALVNYKTVMENPIAQDVDGMTPENIDGFFDVQSIIDWVYEQNDAGNLPDFGPNTTVDRIYTLTRGPEITGYDKGSTTARYMLRIRAEYYVWRTE